jgi:hypothetical protein
MADYSSDEALAELHDEMYREEDTRSKSGFSKLSDQSKLWVGIFAGALVLMIYFEKITFNQGLVVGGVAALVLYLLKGTSRERNELTWLECMLRVHDLLEFLQSHPIGKHPQIPPGEIRVRPVGRKQWYEGRAFKRSFAVNIYDEELDVEEMYFVELDVFTGDILTFREAPEGVRGDETKDVKLMPTPDMMISKKRDEYMRQKLYGK